jgi:GDP-mannose 6-dehydrogenase
MKVAIFGLGYVGAVSAGCLCRLGHGVIGVDLVPIKREKIAQGLSPVVEPQLGELIAEAVDKKQLTVTGDADTAVADADVCLICVGTPSRPDGSLNLDYVARVCRQIGEALPARSERCVVAIRSTMLPGAAEATAIPALEEASGMRADHDFGFCLNPEFLREGSAVADFMSPPKTVIGSRDERSAKTVAALYQGIEAPLFLTPLDVAALVKYVDNAFHALKVTFANEIGTLCKRAGVDSHAVMEIVCADRKLNISPAYLMPGFAFGGSCLPKDLRALLDRARQESLAVPVLSSMLPSNELHIRRVVDEVISHGKRPVGVLGIAFKPQTDDLRESPIVAVIEALIGKGFELRLFDRNVSLAAVIGANRDYILNEIPHISSLMHTDPFDVVDRSEIVIVASKDPEFKAVLRSRGSEKIVIDLARQFTPQTPCGAPYIGICW